MRYVSTFIKALLLVCAVVFCVINTSLVEVTFLPWPEKIIYRMPLFLPILISFFIGIAIMLLIFAAEKFRLGKEIKKLRKQLAESAEELNRIQNIPLIDEEPSKNNSELL